MLLTLTHTASLVIAEKSKKSFASCKFCKSFESFASWGRTKVKVATGVDRFNENSKDFLCCRKTVRWHSYSFTG